MKLKFNFNGKTLLRDWWGMVRDNFQTIQNEHNSLNEKVSEEITNRQKAQEELNELITAEKSARCAEESRIEKRIITEISDRKAENAATSNDIAAETAERKSADISLGNKIDKEIAERNTSESFLSRRIGSVETNSHSHGNKNILDCITDDDIQKWNGIKSQVSKSELDAMVTAEARERADADNSVIAMLENYAVFTSDMIFAAINELYNVYTVIGVKLFDGGVFGMEQTAVFDGGIFDDTELAVFDCGGFEHTIIPDILDGGIY